MADDPIVIVGCARTPMGGLRGQLAAVSAPELGATAIRAALQRGGVPASEVRQVIMGCVLSAGLGQGPARQAALAAGIPVTSGCTTVNKLCGSGMQAVILAHDQILAGSHSVMVAGGMESMSRAPHLLPKVRAGLRLGHGQVLDHMFTDGLEDAASGRLMGTFAQESADQYGFSRAAMDGFAIESLSRAREAMRLGILDGEIAPVAVGAADARRTVIQDEQPNLARPERIGTLRPAFSEGGTITAANSSSISDGASALVLMRESEARHRSCRPLAKVVAHATNSLHPSEFTFAPVGAVERVLHKSGWKANSVDRYEINEAFAMVTMLATRELSLDPDKVNVFGGACAQGHPIGSSGSRILVTLLNALSHAGLCRGIATLCIGGGEATAVALERCL